MTESWVGIERVKESIISGGFKLIEDSIDGLVVIGGGEIIEYLISLLSLPSARIRNRAALVLKDLKAGDAVGPLLAAINKKENFSANGTLVYALEGMDCSDKLVEVFRVLFFQGYEAKMGALAILENQSFEFGEGELSEINEMWKACLEHPRSCPSIDELKLEIQGAVDGFLGYLGDK